jgi:hypothetical protein
MTHFLVKPSCARNAFGGTPKAAGEDARTPQANCMVAVAGWSIFHLEAVKEGFF